MTRVVVVSGGGSGIGSAVAGEFAAEEAHLVLTGRREQVLRETAGRLTAAHPGLPEPLTVAADLSSAGGARRVADEVAARFDRVDVVVANAGGNPAAHGGEAIPEGLERTAWAWSENFRVNTLTAVLLTEALKDRLASPGGRVVLISSIAALRGSGTGSYAASKAALHPYAFDLARELGPRGITVNVVAPGYIRDTEFFSGGLAAERERALIEQTSTGRAGTPADVADAVRWLAAPGAGQVTAQIIQVNGGAERGR
ncbi:MULTISPECIES: SDR family NAD(P)-dependent oxidoreductase [Streptomycetaceae]|nr:MULTISPECIES: SDR family oxidoreductase [Streptomycetaceae]